MYNRNLENSNENERANGNGSTEPCKPNPRCYEVDRVVATWKTVRHYKITTHDTIEPVCTDGMRDDDFGSMFGRDRCECR